MLQLPGTLTQTTATACLQAQLRALAHEPASVVIDASQLKQFDSVALAVLLELSRQAFSLGKSCAIAGLPVSLGDLARLYGIADLLPAQA